MRAYLLIPFLLLPASAATVGQTDRFIPLVQDGSGWSTQVTLVNLSSKPASIIVTFMTAGGFVDNWKVQLKASVGKVVGSLVDVALAPGAVSVIETSGTPTGLTRGFVEIVELGDQPVGAFATLTRKDGARVVQRFKVPLSPVHERKSILPVDLSDPTIETDLVWVSLTASTTLDIIFRNQAGEQVFIDQVFFDGRAQIFLNIREQWPQLKDFRGTMQWAVTFPNADRYESRILSGTALLSREGQVWNVLGGMTLPADQATSSPY